MNENCTKCWGLGLVTTGADSKVTFVSASAKPRSRRKKARIEQAVVITSRPRIAPVQKQAKKALIAPEPRPRQKQAKKAPIVPDPRPRKGGCPFCSHTGPDIPRHVQTVHGDSHYRKWISCQAVPAVPVRTSHIQVFRPTHKETFSRSGKRVTKRNAHLSTKHFNRGSSASSGPPSPPVPAKLLLTSDTISRREDTATAKCPLCGNAVANLTRHMQSEHADTQHLLFRRNTERKRRGSNKKSVQSGSPAQPGRKKRLKQRPKVLVGKAPGGSGSKKKGGRKAKKRAKKRKPGMRVVIFSSGFETNRSRH